MKRKKKGEWMKGKYNPRVPIEPRKTPSRNPSRGRPSIVPNVPKCISPSGVYVSPPFLSRMQISNLTLRRWPHEATMKPNLPPSLWEHSHPVLGCWNARENSIVLDPRVVGNRCGCSQESQNGLTFNGASSWHPSRRHTRKVFHQASQSTKCSQARDPRLDKVTRGRKGVEYKGLQR